MLKITPLAADSMGCRSMATFVETRNCKILIDPGVSLDPFRHGLKPHPVEEFMLKKCRERLVLYGMKADVIVATHYEDDHFYFDLPRLFQGKQLLLKNPNQYVPVTHRNRVFQLLRDLEGQGHDVTYADGRSLDLGNTRLTFSAGLALARDPESRFIQCAISDDDQTFLFTSQVAGFFHEASVEFLLSQDPTYLYLDGPDTVWEDPAEGTLQLNESLDRMLHVMENTRVARVILDHHLLRDMAWKDRVARFLESARKRHVLVQTAADLRGEPDNLLEARRNKLYEFDQSL